MRDAIRYKRAGFLASVAALLVLAGCAANPAKDLVPGRSTRAEVEQQMGAPAHRLDAGGESVWFYPRPGQRQTYAVRIDRQGVVRAVEERLTREYIAKVAVGRSEHDDVLAALGPPRSKTQDRRNAREIWEYEIWGSSGSAARLWVQFSDDGKVREVVEIALPRAATFSA